MPKNRIHDAGHSAGCGCKPTLFTDMIEKAGLELSRREFIKGAAAVGGMLSFGALAPSAFAASQAMAPGEKRVRSFTVKSRGVEASTPVKWQSGRWKASGSRLAPSPQPISARHKR